MPTPNPDLSVVIPVFNARASLERLVTDFRTADELATQVILVDDASTDGSSELVSTLADALPNVVGLHNDRNRGAGTARNRGFDVAEGRYTLFFDADDIVDIAAVTDVVRLLDLTRVDVGFTTYRYRRGHDLARTSMNNHDIEIWDRYVPEDSPYVVTRLTSAPSLLGFSNYPWNKVVRTSTYRERGLQFGSGSVHNDVLGHWYTLLFADEILLVDRPICMHIVEASGLNLTNQMSRRRLELFDALNETYDFLLEDPMLQNRYAHHYWKFAMRTIDWAGRRIDPQVKPEFNRRQFEHLLRLDISDLARIRLSHDPSLADRMVAAALA